MTIATIRAALVDVVAAAISARYKYDGLPNLKPQALPAVAAGWDSTTQATREQGTHASKVSGKTVKRGAWRNHDVTAYALLSTTGDAMSEDASRVAAAQAIVDAIDEDATLQGALGVDACTWCDIVNIEPYSTAWDGTQYDGVKIAVRIQEL